MIIHCTKTKHTQKVPKIMPLTREANGKNRALSIERILFMGYITLNFDNERLIIEEVYCDRFCCKI